MRKLVLMSELWYVMQVLCCSRVHVQNLHRIFAVFIWGSTWEKCSRTNLFRRVKHGGLSLSHLFVRQLVNRFIFFRDVQHPF
uniref:Putative tick transposon n=1 Tax=Rhipicephalus microplus TaxID=6941 RepID=A0A6M2DA90_RHIMP